MGRHCGDLAMSAVAGGAEFVVPEKGFNKAELLTQIDNGIAKGQTSRRRTPSEHVTDAKQLLAKEIEAHTGLETR